MLLEVRNVDSGYGDVQVLRNVSIGVEEGEIVSIVGANGAGKTTLIRTIMGTLAAKQGEIHFGGRRIDGLEPHMIARAGIAQVMEGRRLFGHMAVEDNLLIGGDILHDKARQRENLEWIYGMFPRLRERRSQLARSFSGGEQQMLAIGRALMGNPELLLLDEPFEGLAPVIVDQLYGAIEKLKAQSGMGIVLVEQHAEVALELTERALVLDRGQTAWGGASPELLADAAKLASLIGLQEA